MTEFEIIDRYFRNLATGSPGVIHGIGDDAAVLEVPSGQELLVSVDTLVADIHFPRATAPADIGYKALAVNLSDLAAMAGEPRWVTLSLTLPEFNADWLSGFCHGFAELAKRTGVSLVGGDMSHGPLSITVQVMGIAPAGTAISRDGARPGDRIYVSGCLGGAAHALKQVLNGMFPAAGGVSLSCRQRLQRPVPRLEAGLKLRGLASAAIDISDGLVADLGHILNASSAGARIELARIPVCPELENLDSENEYWLTAIGTGDDYELCFTVPENRCDKVEQGMAVLDCPVTRIGKIEAGNRATWLRSDGTEFQPAESGYHHF